MAREEKEQIEFQVQYHVKLGEFIIAKELEKEKKKIEIQERKKRLRQKNENITKKNNKKREETKAVIGNR